MRCPRCLNEEPTLFAVGSKGFYCRACIGFKRQLLLEEMEIENIERIGIDTHANLSFELTKKQKEIASQLKRLVSEHDVLIYAVCGAGKTEMLLDMLEDTLRKGKKVAIAIARRQVVLELAERLQQYFTNIKVTPVCQGYTSDLNGDLIVCTTHQLYRYTQCFDVLVLDEPDAFPYYGNPVLKGISQTSCKGHRVYLTATPDEEMMEKVNKQELVMLSLMERPHEHKLPEPNVLLFPKWICFLLLFFWLKKKKRDKKQAMIFCPTIKITNVFSLFFSLFFSVCKCTSKTVNKDQVIDDFKKKKKQFIFCTSILERGVTFSGVDVAVFYANHAIFNEASLIQIAGRVGRKKEYPSGEVIFYAFSRKESIKKCVQRIQQANGTLSFL